MFNNHEETIVPAQSQVISGDNKKIMPFSNMRSRARYIVDLLEMIKIGHTVFALPFAISSVLVTANGFPKLMTLVWILVAMTGARTAAMTFNRIVDKDIDKKNPRTSNRALATGCISTSSAVLMLIVSIIIFSVAAGKLGALPLKLVPLTLLIILGYSFCKHFTMLSHFVLGLALAIAPIGACIAINNTLTLSVCLLAVGVFAWTAGFDIIYALQDVAFDHKQQLYSLPSRIGILPALWVSRIMHLVTIAAWMTFNILVKAHLWPWMALALVATILIKEQWVVRRGSLEHIDYAFFTLNSFIGIIFCLGHVAEWVSKKFNYFS